MSPSDDLSEHWEERYRSPEGQLSWHEATPMTLEWVGEQTEPGFAVIDIGSGSSHLVDHLLDRGYSDLTLLDISSEALEITRQRLGDRTALVQYEVADLHAWRPTRTFDCWHDRAVFHFMVTDEQRRSYLEALDSAVARDGGAVVAAFANEGPASCAGLPTQRYTEESLAHAFDGVMVATKCDYFQSEDTYGDQRPYVVCSFVRDQKSRT